MNNTTRLLILKIYPLYSETFVVISAVLCFCTNLAFISLIWTVCRQKSLRVGSGVLILHQLLTEFLVVAIHWPVFIWNFRTAQAGFPPSQTFCRHYQFWYMSNVTAGLWGMAALAVNRFVAVCFTFIYRGLVSPRSLLVMVLLPWTIGIGIHIHSYIGLDGGFAALPPFAICGFVQMGFLFGVLNIFRMYATLFSAFFYILILAKVGLAKLHDRQILPASSIDAASKPSLRLQETTEAAANAYHKRLQMAKSLGFSCAVHGVSFLAVPVMLFAAPTVVMRNPMLGNWLRLVYFLGFLSTPVSLALLSREHRNGIEKLLRACHITNDAARDQISGNIGATQS